MADDQQTNPAPTGDTAPPIPGVQQQGNDQSQDWTQTQQPTQQTSATPSTPPDAGGTPQGPQQTPAQTAQQFPFPGAQKPQGGVQSQGDGGEDGGGPPGAPKQPLTPQQQKVVQNAGWVHTVLKTLSGGDQQKTVIDPNTGKSSTVTVPMSNGQYARGLAAAVLTGAFSGLGEKGPGAEGRAAEDGFSAVAKQKQQAQAQQQQQASQDFARQAATAQTNFQTRENNLRLSKESFDVQKNWVDQSAESLQQMRDQGHVIAEDVAPEDLMPKYHVAQDQAIPSRVVQTQNPDGSLSARVLYSVVDPAGKINMPQQTAQFLADHHVPGTFKIDPSTGKAIPLNFEGSAAVKVGIVTNQLQNAGALNTTEHLMNKQLADLPDSPQVNITKAFDQGTLSTKALKAFAPFASYDHLDEAITDFTKSKANQDSGGVLASQIRSLIPSGALDQITKTHLDQVAADKSKREAAAAVVKQQAELPGVLAAKRAEASIQSAHAYQEGFNHEAGSQAAKAAAGVASGTLTGKLKNNDLYAVATDPSEKPINGVNQNYLNSLKSVDPAIAAAVEAVGHGQAFVSNYGLAKDAGQHFLGLVHQAFPEFAVGKANEYEKQLSDFGINGKTGKANTAGSTLMEHLLRLHDAVGIGSATGTSGAFGVDAANATNEAGTFYANGNKPGEAELKDYRDEFRSPLPWKVQSATKAQAIAAMDKIKENYNTQARATPSSFGKPQPILSEDAANAYNKLTGDKAPDYLVDHTIQSRAYANDGSSQSQSGQNTSQAAHAPYTPPSGSFRKLVNGAYQYRLPTGQIVDSNGQAIQQ